MARKGWNRFGILLAGIASAALVAACSGSPTPPSPSSSGAPSASETPSPKPVLDVNVSGPALKAAAAWLKQNGYQVQSTSGAYLKFSDEGSRYTSKMTCEGGAIQRVGWLGVCAAPSTEAIGLVVTVRVTGGPKIATLAMDEDTAGYCGDETTPAWAKTALKTAEERYCFLKAEDG